MRLIDADVLQTEYKARHDGKRLLLIDVAPTIEPMRKKGRWERTVLGSTSGYGTTVMYQCSECSKMSISEYHFCPNCGADMREGQE